MGDPLLAPESRGRERFGGAFLSIIMIGWAGAAVAFFGTRWDARVDTEDALLAHFLGWFLTAYTIGAGVGLFLLRGRGVVKPYIKVVAWTLFGALFGGFLFVEDALAGAKRGLRGSWQLEMLSLLVATFPWTVPLIAGSVAFAFTVKQDTKAESPATRR